MSEESCLLCERIAAGDVIAENDLAAAVSDAFPVAVGHALIVSRRHVSGLFDLEPVERRALLELLDAVRIVLDAERHPDGYNVGVNVGAAAGQTVPHVHIHLIPRYAGDVEDPRGGVRWVIPRTARYWDKD